MNTHHRSEAKPIMLDEGQRGALAGELEHETSTRTSSNMAPRGEALLIDVREISKMLSISEPTLWRWCQSGEFPQGILITPKMRRWYRSEVVAWVAQKAAEQPT